MANGPQQYRSWFDNITSMVESKTTKAKQQHKLHDKLFALRVKKPNKQKMSEPQTIPSLQGVLGIQSLLREIELKLKRH